MKWTTSTLSIVFLLLNDNILHPSSRRSCSDAVLDWNPSLEERKIEAAGPLQHE